MMMLTACYEDKGNYTYSEIEEVTVEFPASIVAMEKTEPLTFSPKIVSSIAGDITDSSDDYEFGCQLYRAATIDGQTVYWHDINPEKTKDINIMLTDVPAGTYTLWYTVTNKKTGVNFNFKTSINIVSTTSEGWMVLSKDNSNKARLGIVYTHANGTEMVNANILPDDAPEIIDPTGILMVPVVSYATGDEIYLTARQGSYKLSVTTLLPAATDLVRNLMFISPEIPGEISRMGSTWAGTLKYTTLTSISTEGNCYGITSNYSGACFEFPLNTDTYSGEPTYKVAQFMGTSQSRPANSYMTLFYDITNKRFMVFNYYLAAYYGDQYKKLFRPNEPENANFSFDTGMDIVDMESTRFSNGEVFSVLQDETGHRHVYGIIVTGYSTSNTLNQGEKYSDITATDFDTADDYAFHSQYPLMFYSKGNKVYCYNLGTRALVGSIDLPASEKITKIKFNLYQTSGLNYLTKQTDEFMDMQYKLIVATTDGSEGGSKIRFYNISDRGDMSLDKEFGGFTGEIVDVVYRERHT